MSYTDFTYSDLSLTEKGVSFCITNTGNFAGAEIAQLYIEKEAPEVFRPAHELKGFSKVFLKPGETGRIEIPFEERTFAYFNVQTGEWEIEEGNYKILIAKNSRECVLQENVYQKGTGAKNPYKVHLSEYETGHVEQVSDDSYEKLLGYKIPDGAWNGELEKNDAFCQLYYAKGTVGRIIYRILDKMMKKSEKKGEANLDILFFYNMPFRGLINTTHGIFTSGMVDGFVKIVNGHLLTGLGKMLWSAIARK